MTIKEIANSLGVSTATVSNVIHGHLEKMSPETAQLIRKKLEQYQYIPNMGARMLAKGDSEIVGVITNYPNREEKLALADPFVSEMIAALENTRFAAAATIPCFERPKPRRRFTGFPRRGMPSG